MQTYYYPTDAYYPIYRQDPVHNEHDQRFFPFLLPFVAGGIAGLAVSPWLFNRPFYQPYPYPTPYPYPYPVPYPTPYSAYPGYTGNPALQQPYAAPVQTPDFINNYNR